MEETEKKKKGRPRKNSVTPKDVPAEELQPAAGESVSEENAVLQAEEKTDKKKRTGRAKKTESEKKRAAKTAKTAENAENSAESERQEENAGAKIKQQVSPLEPENADISEKTAENAADSESARPKASARGKRTVKKAASAKSAAQKTTVKKAAVSKTAAARGRKKAAQPEQNGESAKTVQLALSSEDRLALAASEMPPAKELEQQDFGHTVPVPFESAVPAELGAKELAVYEKGELVPAESNAAQNQGEERAEAAENSAVAAEPAKRGGRKSKKARTAEDTAEDTDKKESAQKRGRRKAEKEGADFVAGVNGVVQYNGEESLSAFGEQAGLGVLGIIDEAPAVDALLPLVSDAEKPKRQRKRGRKKKQPKESIAAVEFDASPIVEDGEIARIEAEETLRRAQKSKKESPKAEKKEHVRRVLYVSTVPDEQVEVVITENGVVSEYFVEMAHQSKIRGNIYKGVINNVDTNLQAAFVNFGCGKNGFLQIDEVHPEYYLAPHEEGTSKYPPIQKVLKTGQEVLVQVVKEPNGTKGAFLTTWLSLAGRFLVLTPGQEQIGVSRKVEDNEERQRLRALLNGIKPGENMGVIIRTASEGASKANIQKDLQMLKRTWKNIQKQVLKAPVPSLVYQEADLATRAVRDYLNEDIDEVWVDSKDVQKSVADLIKILFPKNKEMLHLHEDPRQTLWERFNIARQLEEVTKREVNLPSGGRLVFDQTEALMAIDINSGKSQGKNNFEAMVFRTNMEAVEAIARHLRLRDIGGQVVIDFIEMRDKSHCREVEKALHAAMKRDRARHDIGKLSGFGLLELVRQRTGSSVISITSEPCPHCRGTGFRRNLEWQAQGVLRDIRSKLAAKNVPSTYVHHVDQEIAFYLLNKKRDRLSDLEHEFGVKIEIHLK